jgi:hypothetical protein
MTTYVVHCMYDHFTVYIGRGKNSKWGNPFIIGTHGNRIQCITQYDKWLDTQPQLLADLIELVDMTLGCWCAKPGQTLTVDDPLRCHGQILARRADKLKEVIDYAW